MYHDVARSPGAPCGVVFAMGSHAAHFYSPWAQNPGPTLFYHNREATFLGSDTIHRWCTGSRGGHQAAVLLDGKMGECSVGRA